MPVLLPRISPAQAGQLALGLLLALGLTVPAQAQPSVPASAAEAQLEQIRQAIVNAAADRPTQVLSTAWIDQQGRLHETAHFQTDGEVRSVRMPLFDKAKEPAKPLNIKVELLPSAWRQKMKPETRCEEPGRRWRQPLKLFAVADPGLDGSQSFHSQTLLQEALHRWQEQVQRSTRWWPQTLTQPSGNSYETALTASTDTQTAWAVRIALTANTIPLTEPAPWYVRLRQTLSQSQEAPTPVWLWQLSMTMGTLNQDGSFEPQWTQHMPVPIFAAEQQASPQAWQTLVGERLQPIMREWAQTLEKAWSCEPVQFQVSSPPGSGLLINAGQRSGLLPGDRLLLVAPEHIPQRIMENGAMAHLRLAEVVRVGAHQTAIRQLAGPAAATHGRWLALPL